MSPEEINKLLASTRNQKFRKKSENWIDGTIKHKIAIEEREQNTEYISKRQDALKKTTQNPGRNKKISEKALGRKKPEGFGDGVRQRNLERGPVSAETGAKISAANTGKKRPAEAISATAAALRGRPKSDEHRQKLSDANKGKKIPEHVKEKMSKTLTGKKKPAGHGEKVGRSKMKCIVSPHGIFPSRKELIAKTGITSWMVGDRLKNNKNEWYYISREEYIVLTGQDPFDNK